VGYFLEVRVEGERHQMLEGTGRMNRKIRGEGKEGRKEKCWRNSGG
jgi:hypothetical protein